MLYFTRKILQLRLGRILTEGVFTSKNKEKKRKNNINEKNKDHIALYLTACSTEDLIRSLQQLPSTQIELVKKCLFFYLSIYFNIHLVFFFFM